MTEPLPRFRYHPDPLATGAVEASSAACACCGRVRGFAYVGPVYAEEDLDVPLCPWCIADGRAAAELGACFVDSDPLAQAGVARDVIDEITLRTPGYFSWQQECWLAHCGDACEFHGDASVEDIAGASSETKADWRAEYRHTEATWDRITANYRPRGAQAFYKFVCRHCGRVRLGWDCA
jgi:uncharacterized protein CbrC (UPF0167 family)